MIIMLGSADRRVPPSQGIQYYNALREAGKPARLIVYEGETHAIVRPDLEADALLNAFRLFSETDVA